MLNRIRTAIVLTIVAILAGCAGYGEVAYLPTVTPTEVYITVEAVPTSSGQVEGTVLRPDPGFIPHSLEDASDEEIIDYTRNWLYRHETVFEQPQTLLVRTGSAELIDFIFETTYTNPEEYVLVVLRGEIYTENLKGPVEFAAFSINTETGMPRDISIGPGMTYYERPGTRTEDGERIRPEPWATLLTMEAEQAP